MKNFNKILILLTLITTSAIYSLPFPSPFSKRSSNMANSRRSGQGENERNRMNNRNRDQRSGRMGRQMDQQPSHERPASAYAHHAGAL